MTRDCDVFDCGMPVFGRIGSVADEGEQPRYALDLCESHLRAAVDHRLADRQAFAVASL